MSLRFGRSIKIAKGFRVNVSKSGLGLSIGPRGASISVGTRGTYSNVGLPGSGLSIRKKIDRGNSQNYGSSAAQGRQELSVVAKISINDETGKETIWIESVSGAVIHDDSLLRKIKRTEAFKAKLEETRSRAQKEISEKTAKLISIYTNSEVIVSKEEIEEKAKKINPVTYEIKSYPVSQPRRDDLLSELIAKSRREIKSWKFWAIKKLRKAFVESSIDTLYNAELSKWEADKKKHEEAEHKRKIEIDLQYLQDYEATMSIMKKVISGDDDYIKETIEDMISEIQLPLDFSISFQVKDAVVDLDIDLPEIEDYPLTKSEILQSGKLSVKKKTQTEIYRDYATSVVGLAFYFASIVFNISPAIPLVRIAGYTQRLSKKTGKIEDQYIYYIQFDRSKFATLKVENIDPLVAIDSFTNKRDMTSKFELREIEI